MAKVTSKYQVSIPKSLAEQLRIRPGDDIEWRIAGEELRVSPLKAKRPLSVEERLDLFDQATKRQAARNKKHRLGRSDQGRGWKREDLYHRGRTR
jgi:AbrB family looped-hinge helix DNA binding protein